jgi:hypothetical protein
MLFIPLQYNRSGATLSPYRQRIRIGFGWLVRAFYVQW